MAQRSPDLAALTPQPADSNRLFPAPINPVPKPAAPATPSPARGRDEDMPLRPGDVLAVGLTNKDAHLGQVAAVNEYCFRLDLYSWLDDGFNGGVAVVAWWQVGEFGPVALKRRGAWDIKPLREFAEEWERR